MTAVRHRATDKVCQTKKFVELAEDADISEIHCQMSQWRYMCDKTMFSEFSWADCVIKVCLQWRRVGYKC